MAIECEIKMLYENLQQISETSSLWFASFAPLSFCLFLLLSFYHMQGLWLMFHLFSVETVQLALWCVDPPTNPCLCSLISSAPPLCVHTHSCLCAHACVKAAGFGDKENHIILQHRLAWHNPISSPLCFFSILLSWSGFSDEMYADCSGKKIN